MGRDREKIFLRRCFQEKPIFYRMFVPGMTRGISLKRLLLFPVILYLAAAPSEVRAAQQKEYTMPPHLIQSVTEQDAYESMILLGMLECPVLETVDCERAYENVNSWYGECLWKRNPVETGGRQGDYCHQQACAGLLAG